MERESSRRTVSRRTMVWMAVGAAALCALFVGLSMMENHQGSHVQGRLASRGGELGSFTLSPNYCVSGIGAGYEGAQLMRRDERWNWYVPGSEYKRPIVRVMQDPSRGPLVSVALPGRAKPVVLDGSHCRTFKVVIHRSVSKGSSAPGHFMDGSLDLDCDALSGSVRFSGCF